MTGVGIDFTVQMGIQLSQGKGIQESFNNVDWTSVNAAGMIGALTVPGIGTTAKLIGQSVAIAVDAGADISINEQKSVGGIGGMETKPLNQAISDGVIDAAVSFGADKLVNGAKSAVKTDLKPTTFSTLNKSQQNVVKGTDKVVNSKGFEVGIGSFLSTAGKAVGNASSNFSIKQSQPENTVTTPSQSYYQEDRNW